MATRSTIAVIDSKGQIHSIYCHNDGYIKRNNLHGVGTCLLTNYNSLELALELLQVGDLSGLGETVWTSRSHNSIHKHEYYPSEVFDSLDNYLATANWQEYNYIFKDGNWYLIGNQNQLTLIKILI